MDLELSARIQSHKNPNKSIHWFHEYSVKDRVSADQSMLDMPQKSLDDLEMKEFIPTPEVHEEFIADFKFLIPRVIVDYLPAYKPFSSAVPRAIPHAHSDKMAKKSEVVSRLKARYSGYMYLYCIDSLSIWLSGEKCQGGGGREGKVFVYITCKVILLNPSNR